MVNVVAKFEKVSFDQFKKDCERLLLSKDENIVKEIYEGIKLPIRATSGSAGYDFFSPIAFSVESDYISGRYDMGICQFEKTIPTGIRCRMEDNWVLQIYPRSEELV